MTSKTKFTKGEWRRSHHANGQIYVTHKDMRRNSGRFICTLSGRDELANAVLIAQAPSMYHELEKQKENIKKVIDQLFNVGMDDAWTVCKLNDMLDDIEAQLSKARGDSL